MTKALKCTWRLRQIFGQLAEACLRARRAFGNPSYHVQALFAEHQGVLLAQTSVDSQAAQDNGIAASATCADFGCTRLSLKVRHLPCQALPSGQPAATAASKQRLLHVVYLCATTGCRHTCLHGMHQP